MTNTTSKAPKKKTKIWSVDPSHLGACIKLTGRLNDGILLYRILSRSQKKTMKDEFDQLGWIVLTREEWMTDTGLTRHQYDEALSRINKKDYVERRHRKKKYMDRNAIAWLKITEKTESALEGIMKPSLLSASQDSEDETLSDLAESDASTDSAGAGPLIENNNNSNNKNSKCNIKEKIVSDRKKVRKSSGKNQKVNYEEVLEEIFKDSQFAPEAPLLENIKKIKNILAYLERRKINFPAGFDLNNDKSICALKYITQNWDIFSYFACEHANAINIPSCPKIWFIYKQQPCIVDFINSKAKEIPYVNPNRRKASQTRSWEN